MHSHFSFRSCGWTRPPPRPPSSCPPVRSRRALLGGGGRLRPGEGGEGRVDGKASSRRRNRLDHAPPIRTSRSASCIQAASRSWDGGQASPPGAVMATFDGKRNSTGNEKQREVIKNRTLGCTLSGRASAATGSQPRNGRAPRNPRPPTPRLRSPEHCRAAHSGPKLQPRPCAVRVSQTAASLLPSLRLLPLSLPPRQRHAMEW